MGSISHTDPFDVWPKLSYPSLPLSRENGTLIVTLILCNVCSAMYRLLCV